jgi:DNA-binding NarL/FixJ family response regulator
LTNRQIAEALVISPPTAERHLANIMNKLAIVRGGMIIRPSLGWISW